MSQSSFVCTQLNSFKFSEWLNLSIWPIDNTLTGTTTPGQSGPGSYDNKKVLHIPQTQELDLTHQIV